MYLTLEPGLITLVSSRSRELIIALGANAKELEPLSGSFTMVFERRKSLSPKEIFLPISTPKKSKILLSSQISPLFGGAETK